MSGFLFDTNVLLDIATASPLPDFYIGAHAEIEQRTLITRDAGRYRTCFPNVVLIAAT